MKVTTVIVDDEPVARAGLRDLLADTAWITVVGEAASGPAAVEVIEKLKPELVFLDIEMPGFFGTELIGRLTHQPHVVFTTAHARHAVAAFELGALDYLLKPFGGARLATALERVQAALGEPNDHPSLDRLREALRQGPMSRLFVRAGAAVIPLSVDTVDWFEARGDYVAAHAGSARHLINLSLNRLEERLDPARFVRIHRTHIVNLDSVRAFHRAGKGRLEAELADGTRVPVSRARSQDLRALPK